MNFKLLLISGLASTLFASSGFADHHEGGVVSTKVTDNGTVIVDARGMSLYTFDADEKGKSNCYEACAEYWPPILGDAEMTLPDGFSVIARDTGTMQVAYEGMPLYAWFKDAHAGETTGDGVNGTWHLAVTK